MFSTYYLLFSFCVILWFSWKRDSDNKKPINIIPWWRTK